MDTFQIIALLIVAAIAGMGSVLDEAQTHRPLVACTLVGIILGDMTTGVILGGTLEMMALGWMNVGLAMAPDTAIASVISTILVILTRQGIGEGIAIAVALAAAGQVLTIFIRTITVFFIHRADKYAEQGNCRGIEIMHIGALFFTGFAGGVANVGRGVNERRFSAGNVEPYTHCCHTWFTDWRWDCGGCRLCDGHQHDECKTTYAILFCRLPRCCFYRFQPGGIWWNGVSRCITLFTA